MSKLLAAVNLPQVGDIAVMEPDAENDDTVDGGCFSIQVSWHPPPTAYRPPPNLTAHP